jgi:tRNA pseudouridine55 synthase
VVLDDVEADAASFGRVLGPAGIEGPYRVCAPDGGLIGIWRDDGPKARPEMVLAPATSR